MTVLTDAQISRLRTRPHRTKLHLSVYQPNTVLAAQINQSDISRGEREITITNLGGDPTDVNRGQTVYIGTAPNGRDVGRIRAISATAGQLTVAENDITWHDGYYLTVVAYYEPWAVFPRIVLNEDNVPQFYVDYDVEYINQNEQMDPVVHMGPNHAGFLEQTPTGAFARVYYTASGSFDPSDNATPTGFAWVFEGGTPTGSSLLNPGYIDYTGAGHFLTSLTATTAFGKSFTGRRHVSIYTRPDEGDQPPILKWGITGFDGSRENGGYSLRLWVREAVDRAKIADGALVVIFTEDWEGGEKTKAGGNALNRDSILFNGYVEEGSVSINPVTNRLEFRVLSVTGAMKNLSGFSATRENVEDAATWNEMTNMTLDKAVISFLRWQSTILRIADFEPTGDTKGVNFADFGRDSIYDAVNDIYANSLLATVIADRQGKIWAEVDASLQPTGTSRAIPENMILTRQDWRNELDITLLQDDRVSYIELGGLAYTGIETGTNVPFLSGAPGDAPSYYGSVDRYSGLILTSQEQLNILSGLAFARENARYPSVVVPVAGEYRNIDIAPQERIRITMDASDNYRGIVWEQKPFLPQSIRYDYRPSLQMLTMDIEVREETDGPPGETVEIPVDPPFDTLDLPWWVIEFPPIMPPDPVDPPDDQPPVTGDLVYVATGLDIARCENFTEPEPEWVDARGDLFSTFITDFKLDKFDPENRAWIATTSGTYRTDNLGDANPNWEPLLTSQTVQNILGGLSRPEFLSLEQAFLIDGAWYVIVVYPQGPDDLNIFRTTDRGVTWTAHTLLGDNQAMQTPFWAARRVAIFEDMWFYVGGRSTASAVKAGLEKSMDGGKSWVKKIPNNDIMDLHVPYPANPLGYNFLVALNGGTSKSIYRSEDGGDTIANVSPVYDGNTWGVKRRGSNTQSYQITGPIDDYLSVFALLNPDEGDGSAAENETILFHSSDFGNTWTVRYIFTPAVSYASVSSLFIHPRNVSWLYALSTHLHPADEGTILYSPDKGLSWQDKTGDWSTAIRDIPIGGFTPTRILPVWTV